MSETKPCACGCGEFLVRRTKDCKTKWAERKYYSRACRNRGHARLLLVTGARSVPQQKTDYQRCVDEAVTINAYWRQRGKDPNAHVTTCDGVYVVRSNLVGGVPA